MRGLLSPPLTYSVTIVVPEEHRADQIRLCPDVISCNARVRCAMPPPPLLDSSTTSPGQFHLVITMRYLDQSEHTDAR